MKSIIPKRLTEYFQFVKEVYYKKSGMYAYPSDLERLHEEIIKVLNDNQNHVQREIQRQTDWHLRGKTDCYWTFSGRQIVIKIKFKLEP